MFKRGGTVNTGIMDGFGEDRVMASSGKRIAGTNLMVSGGDMDDEKADVFFAPGSSQIMGTTPAPTATEPVFTPGEAPDEPLFGLSDYASLFKLGANIASAPGRGTGLGGVLAAAGPSLAQAADEFAASQEAKAARRREFDTAEQARKDLFEAEQRQVKRDEAAASTLFEREKELEAIKFKNELEKIAADAEANPLELVAFTKQYNELVDRQMGLDPSSDEYKRIQESIDALNRPYISPIVKALAADISTSTKATAYATAEIERKEKQREKDGLKPLSASEKADLMVKLEGKYYNLVAQAALGESDLDMAEGGRVELQEGGQAMGMQGSDQSPELSFEELRARLPMEVTDQVVRLLATSEAALLDFANIDTQEDIAIFNQKYNVDLQLPVQVA